MCHNVVSNNFETKLMAKSTNIFGLVREEVVICGIPLYKRQSLSPKERIWLQENSEAERNEWNIAYLAFVNNVKDALELSSEEEAYHAVKEYDRGVLDSVSADRIELLNLRNPMKTNADVEEAEFTFMMNSRIIPDKFPVVEFDKEFGLTYDGEWTKEFTKATGEIHTKLVEFFSKESSGEKDEPATGKMGK
jgi:hypothetical protein